MQIIIPHYDHTLRKTSKIKQLPLKTQNKQQNNKTPEAAKTKIQEDEEGEWSGKWFSN
jgi:hypothetical protein